MLLFSYDRWCWMWLSVCQIIWHNYFSSYRFELNFCRIHELNNFNLLKRKKIAHILMKSEAFSKHNFLINEIFPNLFYFIHITGIYSMFIGVPNGTNCKPFWHALTYFHTSKGPFKRLLKQEDEWSYLKKKCRTGMLMMFCYIYYSNLNSIKISSRATNQGNQRNSFLCISRHPHRIWQQRYQNI